MHFGNQAYRETSTAIGGTYPAPGQPQLVQPADPLTDRIQKALADLFTLATNTEDDLNAVSRRLFGERVAQCAPEKGNALPPNGADEAIALSLSHVSEAAYRVRQLAAELNGRI